MHGDNVAARVAGALLEHRGLSGSGELKVTHEILAKDAGTAREVVTRILKQFQNDGLGKNIIPFCDFVTEKTGERVILRA